MDVSKRLGNILQINNDLYFKTSNKSDGSNTQGRPRTAESQTSRNGSAGSASNGSKSKAALVEIKRSCSGELRLIGASSGLVSAQAGRKESKPLVGM